MPLRKEQPPQARAVGHGLPSSWTYLRYVKGFPFISKRSDDQERARTFLEPRVMEVIDLKPTPEGGQYAVPYTILIYHHFKNRRYIGTKYWHYMPTLVTQSYSNTGSSELRSTCSACHGRFNIVDIGGESFDNDPGCFYWLGPHNNCPKFPYYPEYDIDKIFGHLPLKGNSHRIASMSYLDERWIGS